MAIALRKRVPAVLLLLLAPLAAPTWGQDTLRLARLTGPIVVDGRDLALDVHLLRLRVRMAYDPRLSLSTFWQYNSVEDLGSLNARLRFNVRDGTDLWIVYNESINTDRYSYTPVPPVSQGRSLTVKYTHTLVW